MLPGGGLCCAGGTDRHLAYWSTGYWCTGYWVARWCEAGALPVTVAPRTTTDYCGGEAGGLGTGPASPAQPPHRHTVTHTSPRSILHSHTTNYRHCRPLIGHSDRSCILIGGSAHQPGLSCLLRSVQSWPDIIGQIFSPRERPGLNARLLTCPPAHSSLLVTNGRSACVRASGAGWRGGVRGGVPGLRREVAADWQSSPRYRFSAHRKCFL